MSIITKIKENPLTYFPKQMPEAYEEAFGTSFIKDIQKLITLYYKINEISDEETENLTEADIVHQLTDFVWELIMDKTVDDAFVKHNPDYTYVIGTNYNGDGILPAFCAGKEYGCSCMSPGENSFCGGYCAHKKIEGTENMYIVLCGADMECFNEPY